MDFQIRTLMIKLSPDECGPESGSDDPPHTQCCYDTCGGSQNIFKEVTNEGPMGLILLQQQLRQTLSRTV